ncbi:MAG TPA: hypothetical protein VF812_14590 [Ktedonobacterales bacterium]
MTHAEFEFELVEALNMLLEDERASVEMEVALASGATEYNEREAIAFMGTEDIHFCEQLRMEMEHAGLPVTPQINGVVFQVIGAERYDDRLRAFAHHQRIVAEHAKDLQESNLDGALRDALEGIAATHDRHVQWSEQRASEFAATRMLEFGATGQGSVAATDSASDPILPTDPQPAAELEPTDEPPVAEGQAPASAQYEKASETSNSGADDLVSEAATSAPPALGAAFETPPEAPWDTVSPDAEPTPAARKPRARVASTTKAPRATGPRATGPRATGPRAKSTRGARTSSATTRRRATPDEAGES